MSRRALLRGTMYLGGGLVLAACTSGGSPNDTTATGSGLPDIEGGEVVTDPSQFPASFQESPEFAQQVADRALPPVAERIGQDPLVIRPVHEIGTYGGTIRRGFVGVEDIHSGNLFCAGPDNFLYWDYRQENLVPNIARDFEVSDDRTELMLYLRRGMRWSDGHPFTADDIMFWRDDINLNESIDAPSTVLQLNGRDVVVDKVDDFAVRFRSPEPYGLLPEFMAGVSDIGGQTFAGPSGGGGFAPKHYLSKFHPKYSSEAEVDAAAKDAGFDSWVSYLLDRNSWYLNPDLPTLTPWIVTRPINEPPWEFAANPYSIWVDSEGNQLPYIGEITMRSVTESDVLAVGATAGDYDFLDRVLEVPSLPALVKNEERSDYTIHQAPDQALDATVKFNLAYDKDPEIGDLIRRVEFRRALSLGIDRHQINETFFLGTSTPSATIAPDTSDYFPGAEWRTKWASLDLDQANDLLDGLGLTEKDDAGFRMLPSGSGRIRLDCQSAESKGIDYPAIGDTIRRQWAQIGIYLDSRAVDGTLLTERTLVNEVMLNVTQISTEDPFLSPYSLLPASISGLSGIIGIPYVEWFLSEGSEGTEPPDSVSQLKDAMRMYQRGLRAPETERIQLGKELFKLHADQVWSIGLVGFGLAIQGLYYAKNSLGNVPARILNSLNLLKTPSNALPMTFYYTEE